MLSAACRPCAAPQSFAWLHRRNRPQPLDKVNGGAVGRGDAKGAPAHLVRVGGPAGAAAVGPRHRPHVGGAHHAWLSVAPPATSSGTYGECFTDGRTRYSHARTLCCGAGGRWAAVAAAEAVVLCPLTSRGAVNGDPDSCSAYVP